MTSRRLFFLLPLALAMALMLTACAPKKPLTYEEQQLQDAKETCITAANSINDPPHNSNNRFWASYFEMCMTTRFDVTPAQLKTLWY